MYGHFEFHQQILLKSELSISTLLIKKFFDICLFVFEISTTLAVTFFSVPPYISVTTTISYSLLTGLMDLYQLPLFSISSIQGWRNVIVNVCMEYRI